MARIPMTSGFQLIPEGEYVFRIYDASYDEEFGKIKVKLVTAQGMTMTERFSIKNQDDEINEGALNAFSYLARTATQDYQSDDIDPADLIDKYIRAMVEHNEVISKKTDKPMTFAHLGNKQPADGFDTEPVPRALTIGKKAAAKPAAPKAAEPAKGLDLDSLLD